MLIEDLDTKSVIFCYFSRIKHDLNLSLLFAVTGSGNNFVVDVRRHSPDGEKQFSINTFLAPVVSASKVEKINIKITSGNDFSFEIQI